MKIKSEPEVVVDPNQTQVNDYSKRPNKYDNKPFPLLTSQSEPNLTPNKSSDCYVKLNRTLSTVSP
jgi:hypothetical protein